MPRSYSRPGYTLIELLVVIGIIAILIGLLLPAVQRVRSTASRISCASHLKQIALAAHQYHDTLGALPPGTRSSISILSETHPSLSWRVPLLPFLEQGAIFDQSESNFRVNRDPFAQTHEVTRTHVLSMLICPDDDRVRYPWDWQGRLFTHTSYLGVSGATLNDNAGVFYLNSHVNWNSVTDGLSNTLMIGERPPSPDMVYGWWYAGEGQDRRGDAEGQLPAVGTALPRYREYLPCVPGPHAYGPGQINDYCSTFHFWSLHTGGANFAAADGSVHFLTYAARSVLPALSTRAGGEVAEIP